MRTETEIKKRLEEMRLGVYQWREKIEQSKAQPAGTSHKYTPHDISLFERMIETEEHFIKLLEWVLQEGENDYRYYTPDNNNIPPELASFLKDNLVYNMFFENCMRVDYQRFPSGGFKFVDRTKSGYIFGAFEFGSSPQGFAHWKKIDEKWNEHIH